MHIHRLANPRKGCASIVISISMYLSVSPRGYLPNYKCGRYQILCACFLRLWLDLSPAKGAKSAIYDCIAEVCYMLKSAIVQPYRRV